MPCGFDDIYIYTLNPTVLEAGHHLIDEESSLQEFFLTFLKRILIYHSLALVGQALITHLPCCIMMAWILAVFHKYQQVQIVALAQNAWDLGGVSSVLSMTFHLPPLRL